MRWLVLMALVVACRDEPVARRSDAGAGLGQRVFQPSPGEVRAVPPHSIQATGIGPYLLGTELKDILATLPHGPRVELLELEGVVGYSLVRAEENRLLIGVGSSGRVSFISVLKPEIAKTEGGLGVGATIEELKAKLGPVTAPRGARDPRVVELEQLPMARVVVEGGRAVAIVVGVGGPGEPPPAPAEGGTPAPDRPGPTAGDAPAASGGAAPPAHPCADAAEKLAGAIEGATILQARAQDPVFGCFSGQSPEMVVVGGGEITLYGGEAAKLRRLASTSVTGLVFAGALDVDRDGRHEIAAVSERRTSDALTVRVEVLRVDGGRLVTIAGEEVYRMTGGAAAWVGAKLKDVDLLLRAEPAASGVVEVRGLYLHRVGGEVVSVAPLARKTVTVRMRRKEPAEVEAETGTGTGGGTGTGSASGAAAQPKGGLPPPKGLTPAKGAKPDKKAPAVDDL